MESPPQCGGGQVGDREPEYAIEDGEPEYAIEDGEPEHAIEDGENENANEVGEVRELREEDCPHRVEATELQVPGGKSIGHAADVVSLLMQ